MSLDDIAQRTTLATKRNILFVLKHCVSSDNPGLWSRRWKDAVQAALIADLNLPNELLYCDKFSLQLDTSSQYSMQLHPFQFVEDYKEKVSQIIQRAKTILPFPVAAIASAINQHAKRIIDTEHFDSYETALVFFMQEVQKQLGRQPARFWYSFAHPYVFKTYDLQAVIFKALKSDVNRCVFILNAACNFGLDTLHDMFTHADLQCGMSTMAEACAHLSQQQQEKILQYTQFYFDHQIAVNLCAECIRRRTYNKLGNKKIRCECTDTDDTDDAVAELLCCIRKGVQQCLAVEENS